MSAGDIYAKTPQGVQEVGNRKLKLNPRLRTMLILVDGRQPEFVLKEEAEKVGAPADFLAQLEALQLVTRTQAAPADAAPASAAAPAADEFAKFRAAKDFMNVTVVDALRLKSFFFTLKLERAGTREDLRGLAEAYREAIEKASGAEEAEVLAGRLAAMLS